MAQAMLLKPHIGAWGTPCSAAGGGPGRRRLKSPAACVRGARGGAQPAQECREARPSNGRLIASQCPGPRCYDDAQYLHVDEDIVAANVLLDCCLNVAGRRRRLDLRLEVVVAVGVCAEQSGCTVAACQEGEEGQQLGCSSKGAATAAVARRQQWRRHQ